jgi:hypothetical protein
VGYPDRLRLLQAAGLADRVFGLDTWIHHPEKVFSSLEAGYSEAIRIDSFFPEGPVHHSPSPGFETHSHPPLPDPSTGLSVADYFAACLEVVNPSESDAPLGRLQPTGLQRPPVLWVHPGAGGSVKQWPMENFVEVASRVREEGGLEARWLLGEAELEMLQRLRESGIEPRVSPDLVEWAQGTSGDDYYLGNDSGPTHLAGLLGLRTLAIFGPEGDETRWRPWGRQAKVVCADKDGKWPTVEEVVARLIQAPVWD